MEEKKSAAAAIRQGSLQSVRFGAFELDLAQPELRRRGRAVNLTQQSLTLLIHLLNEAGNVVTREELQRALWPVGTFVEFELALYTAMNRLRRDLGDSAADAHYIETVPKRGYRFIAPIEIVAANSQSSAAATDPDAVVVQPAPILTTLLEPVPLAPRSLSKPRFDWKWRMAGVLSMTIVLLAGAYAYISDVRRNGVTHAVPAEPVSAEQWTFRQLTTNDSDNRITAAAISPDGKLLAYADESGMVLRVLQSGAEHLLPSPVNFRVQRIAWFADDLRLALSGIANSSLEPQIWIVYITGEPARLLRAGAGNGAPAPNGNAFAYTTSQDGAIWAGGPTGDDPQLVVAGGQGETFPYVLWSPDSNRLVFQRLRYQPANSQIGSPKEELETNYRRSYESVDAHSGKLLATAPELEFYSACLLKNGRMIYLRRGVPEHRNSYTLWQAQTDVATGALISTPQMMSEVGNKASDISASSDGTLTAAVFETSHSNVDVAEIRGGGRIAEVRRLTHEMRSVFPHSWTPDSEAVVFESDREGRLEIYKQRLGGRAPEKMASMSGSAVLPKLSSDGKWILFARENTPPDTPYAHTSFALYRVPVNGGTPENVPIGGPLDEFRCPLASSASCVLRETNGHQQFVYYALDPLKGKGRELGRTSWSPTLLGDWDVSPNGDYVAFPIHDPAGNTIRLVPLGEAKVNGRERTIRVKTAAHLSGVNWASDERGFYAEANTAADCDLLYVDLRGNAIVLRSSAQGVWGLPSPDGKKVAFVDYDVDSNVWLRR